MVGSPTRTNWFPHRIDRAQLGAATSKIKLVIAAKLINRIFFGFMSFFFLTRILSLH